MEVRNIVRIAGTDIDGNLPIERALWRIKGIGFMFAHAVRVALGIDKNKKIGELSEEELEKLEDCIKNPQRYGIPSWLYNRRKDYETGEDRHLVTSDLDLTVEKDLDRLKKIKSYRGIRHSMHLPVRGQRTKSGYTYPPYRKHKRGRTIGVGKKKGVKK